MKRADQRSLMNILVVGDEGVGKSSLISTFVTKNFPGTVPEVLTTLKFESSSCTITLADKGGANGEAVAAAVSKARSGDPADSFSCYMQQAQAPELGTKTIEADDIDAVDAIVLVYDLSEIDSFRRLENQWLPLIERSRNGEIPVVLAGNKLDLVKTDSSNCDEKAIARSRQQIVSLLQRFRFVRQCIKCSAKNDQRVDEVFFKAHEAVLYPFAPLFDLDKARLTTSCRKALARTFRIFDKDFDGLLCDSELDRFGKDFIESDFDSTMWKKVVLVQNTASQAALKNGMFTVSGFVTLFEILVSQNRLDVVWAALRKMGYDDDLTLHIPTSVMSSSPTTTTDTTNTDWRLSNSARDFLIRLFRQFDSNKDNSLSGEEIMAIFSILPEPSLPPWHYLRASVLFKDSFTMPKQFDRDPDLSGSQVVEKSEVSVSETSSGSGVTIVSALSQGTIPMGNTVELMKPVSFVEWMGFWHMVSAISPSIARTELYRLGHVNTLELASLAVNMSPLSRSCDLEEVRVVVLGNQSSRQNALVTALCNQSSLESSAELIHDSLPETTFTHLKLVTMKRKNGKRQVAETVSYVVFTTVPNEDNAENKVPCYDAQIVVLDAKSKESVGSAKQIDSALLSGDHSRVFIAADVGEASSNHYTSSLIENAQEFYAKSNLSWPVLIPLPDTLAAERDELAPMCRNRVLEQLIQRTEEGKFVSSHRESFHVRLLHLIDQMSHSVVALGMSLLWSATKELRLSTVQYGIGKYCIFSKARQLEFTVRRLKDRPL